MCSFILKAVQIKKGPFQKILSLCAHGPSAVANKSEAVAFVRQVVHVFDASESLPILSPLQAFMGPYGERKKHFCLFCVGG